MCSIVGGGQAGLTAAFGLMQQRVTNILVIDENPEGREGPWGTYARMPTLRTQKDVGGIDLGLPNLSLRAWFEVQYGRRAWDELYKIPTDIWSRYLAWYRGVLGIPMRNEHAAHWLPPGQRIDRLRRRGEREDAHALDPHAGVRDRHRGQRRAPCAGLHHEASCRANAGRTRTSRSISRGLNGKTVAVLGGAASSFDNAIMAAEHGASRARASPRRANCAPTIRWAGRSSPAIWRTFRILPPETRWRFSRAAQALQDGAAQHHDEARTRAARTCTSTPAAHWNAVSFDGARIQIDATDGPLAADFVIAGTGYVVDLTVKPELAEHLAMIATWRDKFTPPPGEEDESLSAAAYLGPNFEMTEKSPGAAPWLSAVFNFSRGAQMSMGPMPIGLSGIKYGVPRLVQGITRRLFVSDAARYFDGMKAWQDSDDVAER